MRILPAPAGTGIQFRRTDLDDFVIEANGRNVAKVSYATSLMKKGVLISTTEHLLSAFIGVGLDNAIVELNALEVPILDGSAKPIVEAILRVGLRPQRRQRTYLRVLREVEIREGDKFIAVYPAENYTVSYHITFPPPICEQRMEVALADGGYVKEIAPARTFGFIEDEKTLRNMGLIRGCSAENAVILSRTSQQIQNPPLRFDDEFVRHKVLDLIGDLALIGHQVLGRVVAERAGHAMHTALVQRLLKDPQVAELTTLKAPAHIEEAVTI
jgi:UDP-3-O-[3-hydroxymyristoyl] N-acetylglucosamine deacetylase